MSRKIILNGTRQLTLPLLPLRAPVRSSLVLLFLWTLINHRAKEKAVKMQCTRSDRTQKELQSMSKARCHDKVVAQESDEQVVEVLRT